MDYTITLTDNQDAGLAHVAAKEELTSKTYLQNIISGVCDDYFRQFTEENASSLIQKVKADPEAYRASIEAIAAVKEAEALIKEPAEEVK